MIRINRFFTENGIISRREADRAITEGRVIVNGSKASLGLKVKETDRILLDGCVIRAKRKIPAIIAYHKPVGVESTTDPNVRNNICDVLDFPERVFPIGRLDKNSSGLILLTNMGEIVNGVLRPEYHHEKEYIVYTSRVLTDEQLAVMRKGMRLDVGKTRPCIVERLAARRLRIVLTEGKNRQIRRMVEYFEVHVRKLKRIRIMNINLGKLEPGEFRLLRRGEKADFFKALKAEGALPESLS